MKRLKFEQYYNLYTLQKYIKELEIELEQDKKAQKFKKKDDQPPQIAQMSLDDYPDFPIKIDFQKQIQDTLDSGVLKFSKYSLIQSQLYLSEFLSFFEHLFWLIFITHIPDSCNNKVKRVLKEDLEEKYYSIFAQHKHNHKFIEALLYFYGATINNIFYEIFEDDRSIFQKKFMIDTFQYIQNHIFKANLSEKYLFMRFGFFFNLDILFLKEFVKFEHDFEKEQQNIRKKSENFNNIVPLLIKNNINKNNLDFLQDMNQIFKKHEKIKPQDLERFVKIENHNDKNSITSSLMISRHKKAKTIHENKPSFDELNSEAYQDQQFQQHRVLRYQSRHDSSINDPNISSKQLYNQYKKQKKIFRVSKPQMSFNHCSPGFEFLEYNKQIKQRQFNTKTTDEIEIQDQKIMQKQNDVTRNLNQFSYIKNKNANEVKKEKLSDIYNLKFRDINNTQLEKDYPQFKQYFKNEVITNQILKQHKTNYNILNSSKKIIQQHKNNQFEEFVQDILNK